MASSLAGHLSGMESGQETEINHPEKGKVVVRYESRQALGDNNQPAKGYTVGHYQVEGPGEKDYESFRHSPHGPTLMGAKPYAAEQAANRVHALFRDRR